MKTKRKLLNIAASLILAFYPFTFAASIAYAVPSLPSTPDSPDSPDSTPDTPDLPGGEAVGTTGTTDSTGASGDSTNSDGSEVNSSNTDTGADSTNTADSTVDNDTEVDINNDADIDNIISVDALSGGNDADKNTGDGSVTSGDATIDGSLATDANSVSIGALECSTECDTISIGSIGSSNSNTGADSDNTSNSTVSNDNNLDINNNADIDNLVMFDADSGGNSTSYNTGSGTIDAGDAELILTAINAANNVNVGLSVFNVFDDQTGDIIIDFDDIASTAYTGLLGSSNDTTGANSTNTASTDVDNTNTILIDNNGKIINNYYLDADTGGNTADKNTGDGTITTGDANVVFNLINFLNNTFLGGGELLLGVVNIFGNLSGNILLQGLDGSGGSTYNLGSLSASNSTTGADSDNDASSTLSNDTDISLANYGEILNNVTLDANTGDNTADKNTGSGQINTGDTNTSLDITNITNTTAIGNGGTIWMVLVNNMGTWTGQLFDTGSAGGAYSPFFTFSLGPDGSLSASNQNTGAGSDNEAATNIDNDTDIAITNTASVTNNVRIDASTGGNSASKNTGSGSITTGDANIAVNIVNMLNNIFLSGRFAITIVNIFGSFTGGIYQGSSNIGNVEVGAHESIAITPNATTTYSNQPLAPIGTGIGSGSSSSGGNGDSALVLGVGSGDSEPGSITRFSADPGLFDGFKLEYLIFPVIFGIVFTFIRKALVRG